GRVGAEYDGGQIDDAHAHKRPGGSIANGSGHGRPSGWAVKGTWPAMERRGPRASLLQTIRPTEERRRGAAAPFRVYLIWVPVSLTGIDTLKTLASVPPADGRQALKMASTRKRALETGQGATKTTETSADLGDLLPKTHLQIRAGLAQLVEHVICNHGV